jgi:manganese/zinc/iron transport system substrate-binding protein
MVKMKYLLCFLLCLALVGCKRGPSRLDEWRTPNGKIKVLSTTPIINDLVGRIGGERIDHLSLMGSSIDPHSYELVKGDDEKFSVAQLIFYNGLGLEHTASLKTYLTNHSHAVSLGDHIYAEEPSLILKHQGQIDPHIWLDVSLWEKAVDPIVSHLAEADPSGKEYYEKEGARVKKELTDLDVWMQEQLKAIPSEKRYLVTSHDAFNYFARRYLHQVEEPSWKERFCAPEGLAPDGQLGFQDLQRVIDHLQKHRIEIVFPEANVSQDSLKKIAEICHGKKVSIRIASSSLYSDTCEESYESMMKHNVLVLCGAWQTS